MTNDRTDLVHCVVAKLLTQMTGKPGQEHVADETRPWLLTDTQLDWNKGTEVKLGFF